MNIVPSPLPPLALIAGPTASGKSALAMALAQLTGGVIINADASQVYHDLRIVTARPSPTDEARVPHRLYGYVDAGTAWSAAAWASDARAAIAAVHADRRLAIVVGGSGLYLRTLLDGIAPVPPIPVAVRAEVRGLALADAVAALAIADPVAHARLHANDDSRIRRALEVVRATGTTLSDWQAQRSGGIAGQVHLAPLVLTPPREWLQARIAARFATIAARAQEEVAKLLARDLDPALPAMRAIGLRELAAGNAAAAIAATMRYAKRQTTWFAHQCDPSWPRWHVADNTTDVNDHAIMLRRTLVDSSFKAT